VLKDQQDSKVDKVLKAHQVLKVAEDQQEFQVLKV
jgi:hypothetical protein